MGSAIVSGGLVGALKAEGTLKGMIVLPDGFDMGFEAGHKEGYTEGYDKGNADGYTKGETDGRESGYADGYKAGYEVGSQESSGVDADALKVAIDEKTETISSYRPVELFDIKPYHSWLWDSVVVTEDMVKNGLYLLRIADGTQDITPYIMSGEDVDHIYYNETMMPLPQIGEISENLISSNGLSVGYVIAREQSFYSDGCVFVTCESVQGVTKENLDEILYAEAVDVEDAPFTYEETDRPIEEEEQPND